MYRSLYRSFFCALALSACSLFCQESAETPFLDLSGKQQIAIQNAILSQVNGSTISVLDVKKKMDVFFHQYYPHLEQSPQARFQFYTANWRQFLMEMIDHQLILADATAKEIKLSDGEVREEMESRFGPNVMLTLDQIGLTYDETWKMVKEELLVRRMSWWFVHAKAMSQVTPRDIRQAFRQYLEQHPPYQEWKYQVISVRGESAEEKMEKIASALKACNLKPEAMTETLQTMDPSVSISPEYTAVDQDLSEAHRKVLISLSPGEYSDPTTQKSRASQFPVVRIFYLVDRVDYPAPRFDDLSNQLRSELVQQATLQESDHYLARLRHNFGFDSKHLAETLPDDLHPFSLE